MVTTPATSLRFLTVIANSFHVVAKRLDTKEDSMANRLQEKLREHDPSEVYATDRS
ncbi:hypothetical protein [Novosphingobium sp. MMS21-SN21R]|uniref:hypothetical protein n=1 Tax=Novosphingobium sp. MMS21-SN21R TaxID=2969298 RepID=UPI00288843C2|nr:hypothetical protein [Novosphingobium sp. MMS21-SN21R]MDT0509445.1 hypothetical protein [Novosphingobium sp. MMS21-SN21R]